MTNKFIFSVFFAAAIFGSCKQATTPEKNYLEVETTRVVFSASANSRAVSCASNLEMKVSSNQTWCTAKVTGGNAIVIQVEKNEGTGVEKARTAIIAVTAGKTEELQIEVKQEAQDAVINVVDGDEVKFSCAAGQKTLTVEANVSYTAKSSEDWCTATVDEQNLVISVTANDKKKVRTAEITLVVSASEKMTIYVTQEQTVFNVAGDRKLQFSSAAGQKTLPVETCLSFTAKSSKDWCTPIVEKQNLVIRVTANTGKEVRTAVVTLVASGFNDITINVTQNGFSIPVTDFYNRDPFIYVDRQNGIYYLYESSAENNRGGVAIRKSKDLKYWSESQHIFTIPANNWTTGAVWAPKMYEYKGHYYLFVTVNSPDMSSRAVQIIHGDSPEGPFETFSRNPHLPSNSLTLDGHLCVDDNAPYMIFSRDWTGLTDKNGTANAVELKTDLSATVGQSFTLFNAKSAQWTPISYSEWMMDNPFPYRTSTGTLLVLWSSGAGNGKGYSIGIAESSNGKVTGTWKHQSSMLFNNDGGAGMVFTTLDGKLCLTLHQPNTWDGRERMRFYEVSDTGATLKLGAEMK